MDAPGQGFWHEFYTAHLYLKMFILVPNMSFDALCWAASFAASVDFGSSCLAAKASPALVPTQGVSKEVQSDEE